MIENAPHPVGGIDYPRTLKEFDEWFASEAACAEFVRRVRWPDGFRCPSCAETEAWTTGRGQFRCARCQRQTSPTAGTIFEGTRKPLRLWFQAMWYVTNQKHGVSALACSAFSVWAATRRPGRGSTSCGGRWCSQGVTFWTVKWRSMKRTWAAGKPALSGERRTRSRSW